MSEKICYKGSLDFNQLPSMIYFTAQLIFLCFLACAFAMADSSSDADSDPFYGYGGKICISLVGLNLMNVFQAVILDYMEPAQFKATEVPRPTTDLEAMARMAVMVGLGASLPRVSPMADAGRARELLNNSEGKTTLVFLVEYKTTVSCQIFLFPRYSL